MVDLAGTKIGEVLNKDPSSTKTGTVVRAHRTLSGGRHQLERWNSGHAVRRATTRRTARQNGPKFAFAPKMVRMNYLQDVSENNDYAEEEQNNDVGND